MQAQILTSILGVHLLGDLAVWVDVSYVRDGVVNIVFVHALFSRVIAGLICFPGIVSRGDGDGMLEATPNAVFAPPCCIELARLGAERG